MRQTSFGHHGEGHAPNHRIGVKTAAFAAIGTEPHGGNAGLGHDGGESDAASPMAGHVMVPMDHWCQRNQLKQTSGVLSQVLEQVTKVIKDLLDKAGEGNLIGVAQTSGVLQGVVWDREQAPGSVRAKVMEQSSPSNWCHALRGACLRVLGNLVKRRWCSQSTQWLVSCRVT